MTLSLEHPYIKSTPRQGVYWLTVPVQNDLDARCPMYGNGVSNDFQNLLLFPSAHDPINPLVI